MKTKRFFSLLLALALVLTLLPATAAFAETRTYDGSEKLYVNLGAVDWWTNDGAVQRAFFFNGSTNGWSLLEPVAPESSVYVTTVPEGTWTNVILVRCDPAKDGDYWEAKWNQTGDIVLDASKNYITSFSDASADAVWDTYTEPLNEIAIPNGDFEKGDTSNWVLSGLPENPLESDQWNTPNTSSTLSLWASDTEAVEIHARYTVKLTAGTYKFSFLISGQGIDSNLKWTIYAGDTVLTQQADTVTTVDWNVWNTIETDAFNVEGTTEITFDFGGTGPVKYWGHFDDLKLFGTGAIYTAVELEHTPTLAVEKVPGVDAEDFMRGTDVSSYLSIVNSGAKFYDYEGNELDDQGFFNLLAKAGFNYIRLRVWNDPYDGDGNGYGGGNCDVNAAKAMGVWATNAGMKVLIDFHYSDFWADPGKQKAPKAWSGYTVDQKAEAVDAFTYASLKTLLDAGVNVGMVQVGNETTSSICGESSWANKAKIFSAGSAAIRRISAEYEHPILVAVHFTNPERSGNYANQAKNLSDNNVDYDVFASSWYPYWHGTTDNLTSVLKQVADTYGKQVVVAETSWAWTLDDGDGWDNTVRKGNNDGNAAYAFSQQGQADELVSAAKAVTAVGEAGIGVFYWENAWIPVQYAYDESGTLDQTILASNKQKWEQFGSGWAASYATEYDPNDAGKWFGGSAVDNQAMFDFHGKALDSLYTWNYMMVGTEELIEKQVETVETVEIKLEQGNALTLPGTVKVTYNVGAAKDEAVAWDEADVAAVDVNTPGTYSVKGVVTLSYDLGTAETTATVTVTYPNLLQNPGFEESDMSMYTYENGSRTTDDPHSGSRSFHFYNAAAKTVKLSQTVELEPGKYSFSLYTQGDVKSVDGQYIYATIGENTETAAFTLAGWAVWQNPSVTFTVSEKTTVTVGVNLPFGAGGWGTIDDLSLVLLEAAPVEPVKAAIVGQSLSLGGEIGVNFYVAPGSEAAEDLSVALAWADKTATVELKDLTAEEVEGFGTCYKVTAGVPAKEMTEEITATLTVGGEAQEPVKTSVKTYADAIIAGDYSDTLKTLARSMLVYGAEAQKYFGYNTENPAIDLNNVALPAAPELTAATYTDEQFAPFGLQYYGTSLVLRSQTMYKLYFKVTDKALADAVTVTVDGKALKKANVGSSIVCWTIENISAKDITKTWKVSFNGTEIEFGAESYMAKALQLEDAALHELICALYAYNQAAKVYFG